MINIVRKLAVINGYVEIPNAKISAKTAVTVDEVLAAIPGTKLVVVDRRGRGGSNFPNMEFIEFPPFDSNSTYPDDWFSTLNSLI